MLRAKTNWNVDMVRALPRDGTIYELLQGNLYVNRSTATIHQCALLKLMLRLDDYARRHKIGMAFKSLPEASRDGRSLERPDAFIARPLAGAVPQDTWDNMEMLLAVDVMDPRQARANGITRGRFRQRDPIPEYWVLEVDAGIVWRARAGDTRAPKEIDSRLEWQPDPRIEPLVIDLPGFFEEV